MLADLWTCCSPCHQQSFVSHSLQCHPARKLGRRQTLSSVVLQVLLVSAQEALLSRLMLRQEPMAAPEVVRRFKERAFGSSRAVQRKTFSQAELQAAAQDMVEDSGEPLSAWKRRVI